MGQFWNRRKLSVLIEGTILILLNALRAFHFTKGKGGIETWGLECSKSTTAKIPLTISYYSYAWPAQPGPGCASHA